MLSYCLKCEENTKSMSPLFSKARNGGIIILSQCAVCNTEKSRLKSKRQKDY